MRLPTVVIQRLVPHYRHPIFERLYQELGWVVATARAGPTHGLKVDRDAADPPWLHRFDFVAGASEYAASVPLDAICEALDPHAIVAEFSLKLSSTWTFAQPWRRRPQLAYWSQGWNRERGFARPADFASQALRLLLLSAADAQLCYSEEGADYLRRRLPRRMPVFVAHNTLAVETMPGRTIDSAPTDAGAQRLLVLGRMTHDKNVPLVVEAFAQVADDFPAARLVLVGDGPEMPAVCAAARPLGDRVELHGAVYEEARTAAILQGASLLVSGGSVGLGVNHALAYGVPVMLFDGGEGVRHHPEHVNVVDGVTGFRVPGSDAAALAAAMRARLSAPQPAKTAMREAIRAHVDEALSLDRMMTGFRELDAFFRGRTGV